ncbi:HAD family hydrolase [Halorhabdus amylolytica]|uniref:HAD family hydrolase n=1 Tax=Halorhabdus amylolytica TaxID=2559573 RepID=UPI0010AA485B|nr:HAD-IA family hydrolase [Halorhabdus amylolytica]
MSDVDIAYDAVVFDMDGVIVEPTDRDVLVDAVCAAFESFGMDVHREFARKTVLNDAIPVETIREYGHDPEAVWHTRELEASLAQQAHVRNGGKPVYDDVTALDRLDVPLGLVSNNQQATVAFLLAHHDLQCFDTAYGRAPTLSGAARRKPEPDYLEAALSDLDATRAVYVGDKPDDIVAADRAGIDSVHLRRDPGTTDSSQVEPTYTVSELTELAAVISGATAQA